MEAPAVDDLIDVLDVVHAICICPHRSDEPVAVVRPRVDADLPQPDDVELDGRLDVTAVLPRVLVKRMIFLLATQNDIVRKLPGVVDAS